MIKPRFLRKGDVVRLVAPGRKLERTNIETGVNVIQSHGLSVTLGQNLFSAAHNYLSGNDIERLQDLQHALDDSSIQAIICIRGGYGTTRILDQLDFTKFLKSPKWVCGFSDVTALHLKLQSLGVQSIHAAMPVQFSKKESAESVESLVSALMGSSKPLEAIPAAGNRAGEATGKLIGGNLSLLTDSLGTETEIQTDNRILLIEEVGEYAYRLDRMLVQLKRSGKLRKLAGLAVGHMTDIKEGELPFGESVSHMINYHTRDYQYPIAFDFATGHDHPNLAWIEGADAQLTVNANGSTLRF